MKHVPIHITKLYVANERVTAPITSPILSSQVLSYFTEVYVTPGSALLTREKVQTRAGYTYIYKVALNTTEDDVLVIPGTQPMIVKTTGTAGLWLENVIIKEYKTTNANKNINRIALESNMLFPAKEMYFDGDGSGSTGLPNDLPWTDRGVLEMTSTNIIAKNITFKFRLALETTSNFGYNKEILGDLLFFIDGNITRFEINDEQEYTIEIPPTSTIYIACDNLKTGEDSILTFWWGAFNFGLISWDSSDVGLNVESDNYNVFFLDMRIDIEEFNLNNCAVDINYLDDFFNILFRYNWDEPFSDIGFGFINFDFGGSSMPIPPQDWRLWDSPKYWQIIDDGGTINFNLDYVPTRPDSSASGSGS